MTEDRQANALRAALHGFADQFVEQFLATVDKVGEDRLKARNEALVTAQGLKQDEIFDSVEQAVENEFLPEDPDRTFTEKERAYNQGVKDALLGVRYLRKHSSLRPGGGAST